MTTPLTRLAAVLALCVTASLATACAGSTSDTPAQTTSRSPSATAAAPDPSASATGKPYSGASPSCDTMLPAATVADFASIDWASRTDPFYIGDTELPDGILCTWADFEGPASDHVQVYGWSSISDDTARAAEDSLVSDGWIRDDSPDGVYITADPTTSMTKDAQGFGMTYLFGDGWVKVADTKQGLLLIVWPPN